ncbi:hypothetical protein CERSUDRAFT_109875 [Gelatoporia subvermispora B]|uniref:Nucleoside phosphorylase domain-containing protein n=1 Tax=Ceriporiopsis subvermispora (strain B) TaxID=914234 RepID=M2RS61_CERS8|nr:hypothetical protein CERSUDRAFT_109875 [Gelatoporia subvermispora B]
MKDVILSANFPRTIDHRVYHLGLRAGEVANRIVTVGSPSRAHGIAAYLDAVPRCFVLTSERGFTTITGRYKGVPVSIVSIGMGGPNADFFMREVRECLNGDMVVIRLGSCGALVDVPVGTVVVPEASLSVTRNYDFDFTTSMSDDVPYRVSKPVSTDPELHAAVKDALEKTRPEGIQFPILHQTLNASTDSFYSSQGRHTSFPDHNENLIPQLLATHPALATFEMETFHILHLATSWRTSAHPSGRVQPPLSALPVHPSISPSHIPSTQSEPPNVSVSGPDGHELQPRPKIRAAAAQMVFASRVSEAFITPQQVAEVEAWSGKAVLEALASFAIDTVRLHGEVGSVWEMTSSTVNTD